MKHQYLQPFIVFGRHSSNVQVGRADVTVFEVLQKCECFLGMLMGRQMCCCAPPKAPSDTLHV